MDGAGKQLWGWYPAGSVWVPLQVDANGKVVANMSAINLGDLGDVDVSGVADGDIFYYDDATGLWKSKAHVDLTTGVHGAGANHLALFGVASTVVSRIVPKLVSTPIIQVATLQNNSSFDALINGAPTATTVIYDTDTNENSLPNIPTVSQWGRVILHNITRGNTRKITGVDRATNTITTEASTDDWADNDIITTGSQTCVYTGGDTYSRFFDIDISAEVPTTAKLVIVRLFNLEASGVGALFQNEFGVHPYETYVVTKNVNQYASAGYQIESNVIFLPVNNQKICAQMGRYGRVNASGMWGEIPLMGYIE